MSVNTLTRSRQEPVIRFTDDISAEDRYYQYQKQMEHPTEEHAQDVWWGAKVGEFAGTPIAAFPGLIAKGGTVFELTHPSNAPIVQFPFGFYGVNANHGLPTWLHSNTTRYLLVVDVPTESMGHSFFAEAANWFLNPAPKPTLIPGGPFTSALDAFQAGIGAKTPTHDVMLIARKLLSDASKETHNYDIDVDEGVLSLECKSKTGWVFLAELEIDGTITVCALDEAGKLVQELPDTVTVDQFVQMLRKR